MLTIYGTMNLDNVLSIDKAARAAEHSGYLNIPSAKGIEYYYQALRWLDSLEKEGDGKYILVLLDCYAKYIQELEKAAREEMDGFIVDTHAREIWQTNVLRYRRLKVLCCDSMFVDLGTRITLAELLSREHKDSNYNIASDPLLGPRLILSFNDHAYICGYTPGRLGWDENKFDYNKDPQTIVNAENILHNVCLQYIEYCTQASGYAACYPEIRLKQDTDDALKLKSAEEYEKFLDELVYESVSIWYHKIHERAWEPKPSPSPWSIKEEL